MCDRWALLLLFRLTGHASSFFRVFREHGCGADALRVRGRGGLEEGHEDGV